MKKIASIAGVAFLFAVVVSFNVAAPPSAEEGKLQQELMKQFQASADAILKGDLTKFPQDSAEEYVCIDSFGVLRDKGATLDFLKSAQFESWKIEDVKAKLYGHTAVAVSKATAKGKIGGVEVSGQYLATTVLVNRDGKWQNVATQYTRVAKP